ncbi:hypothetical protein GOZ89_24095 [Agrobacterium vitis]|uniref:FAD/NAD(P)-binding protein n=1 Tax=Agrobacterium vitis TaxID=373 RepID=UPI000871CEBE|nr:FAD/NAD(P)-binding protein [Agrobacterium vitis]MCE6078533.1 hypothetical protein [Agrobacterium vitis]MUO71775.1 hypothetical protein [Agrobacterium vitis]MUO87722.1 hypothetical protein [Agrobacterium vitis]MVA36871.1 hypothetical protein [Agrobacterium vitis]MVA82494.1 hypothetical protein [Agrobacterium vitis]
MTYRTLAIVGGGAVAASTLYSIAHLRQTLLHRFSEILVFDPSRSVGPGMVYSPDDDRLLLNRTIGRMSIDKDRQNDFAAWMVEFRPKLAALCGQQDNLDWEDTYAARGLFGQYLSARVSEAAQTLIKRGIQYHHVQTSVTSIDRDHTSGFHLTAGSGQRHRADVVLLATGHGPPASFPHLHSHPQYHETPFPLSRFNDLPSGARVGVIGSRLTAIDFAMTVAMDRPDIETYFLTRSGYLPVAGRAGQPHQLSPRAKALIARAERDPSSSLSPARMLAELNAELAYASYSAKATLWPPLDDLVHDTSSLSRSIYQAEAGGRPWQAVLAALLEHFNTLWRVVPPKERAFFKTRHWSLFEALRVSMPVENAKKLEMMLHLGRIRSLSGLREVEITPKGFRAHFAQGTNRDPLDLAATINCSGTGDGHAKSSLYMSMMRTGLVGSDSDGLISVQNNTHRVFQPNGTPAPDLFAVGEMARNSHMIISSLTVLQRQILEMLDVLESLPAL